MAQEIPYGAYPVQAGVIAVNTAAVASELQGTRNREDAAAWADVYTQVFPAINCCRSKLQQSAGCGEKATKCWIHSANCLPAPVWARGLCLTMVNDSEYVNSA